MSGRKPVNRVLVGFDSERPPFSELMKRLDERNLQPLVHDIAMKHGVTVYEILVGDRSKGICTARRALIVALSCAPYAKSAPEIAKLLGHADHTSVIHARRRAKGEAA